MSGQCYDGASVMGGHLSGVSQKLMSVDSRIIYVHCFAHSLNLAVQSTAWTIPLCRNMFDYVKDIINVIPVSPKRTRIFSETVSDLHSLSRRNLCPLCPTRWTTRHEAIDILLQNYDAVMTTLKGKEKKGKGNIYLYSVILVCHTHKAFRHGSHRYACKLHHACLSFVKVHLMAPPLTEVADIQL